MQPQRSVFSSDKNWVVYFNSISMILQVWIGYAPSLSNSGIPTTYIDGHEVVKYLLNQRNALLKFKHPQKLL